MVLAVDKLDYGEISLWTMIFYWLINIVPATTSFQQQFGHSFGDLLFLQYSGKHPQSAHAIGIHMIHGIFRNK